ncbi:uncharacterized protein LOC127738791 [Mytilus californianus]|uniref:uncharacterized protein LOC127738791 n=1 Tax=Mytilus californianus TaxID=6549 RepID=UPI002247128D|nr:uncharacterized protein LOC127738791 [Mytilus californianus]
MGSSSSSPKSKKVIKNKVKFVTKAQHGRNKQILNKTNARAQNGGIRKTKDDKPKPKEGIIKKHVGTSKPNTTKAPNELLVKSYWDLVKYLTDDDTWEDLWKIRSIYKWITSYNIKSLPIDFNPPPNSPLEYFSKIQCDMGNYANLFYVLCQLADVPCVIIDGIAKSSAFKIGEKINKRRTKAQWNAVLIDGEWRLVDLFWASTCVELNSDADDCYFLTDPRDLLWTHLPDDEDWQLVEKQLPFLEFEKRVYVRERLYELEIDINIPVYGQFRLDLFAKNPLFRAVREFDLICSYIIYSPMPPRIEIPLPDNPELGWGQNKQSDKVGLKPISHKMSKISTDTGQLELKFQGQKNLNLNVRLKHRVLDEGTLSQYSTLRWHDGEYILNLRLPKDGYYAMKLYGKTTEPGNGPQKTSAIEKVIVDDEVLFKVKLPDINYCAVNIFQRNDGNLIKTINKYFITTATDESSNEDVMEEDFPLYSKTPDLDQDDITEKRKEYMRKKMREAEYYKDPDVLNNLIYKYEDQSQDIDDAMLINVKRMAKKLEARQVLLDAYESRNIQDVERGIALAQIADVDGSLQFEVMHAKRLLNRLKMIHRIRETIMEADGKAIGEGRKYANPPKPVKHSLMATLVLLGFPSFVVEDWSTTQGILWKMDNDSIQNKMARFDPTMCRLEFALDAKQFIDQYSLDYIKTVSPLGTAFYVWTTQMIREIESMAGTLGGYSDVYHDNDVQSQSYSDKENSNREPVTTGIDTPLDSQEMPPVNNPPTDSSRRINNNNGNRKQSETNAGLTFVRVTPTGET